MKVLSQASIYAFRALLLIASREGDGFVRIREISEELNISFHFLTKILQHLSRNRILESHRGPSGGVRLSRSPAEIRMIEVVLVLEGGDYFEKCMLGLPGCGNTAPCPVHDIWQEIKIKLQDNLKNNTLETLGQKVREGKMRLSS